MTTVLEQMGDFLPSKLAAELRDAGVDVAGVSAIEDDDGNTTAVQIVCAEDTDEATVASVCKAHDPTPDTVETAPTPESLVLAALDTIDLKTISTPADVITALKTALQPNT